MNVQSVIVVTKPKQPDVARVATQLAAWFNAKNIQASLEPEAAAKADEKCDTGSLSGNGYQEIALIGAGDEGKVMFWSFTSDGKHSQGTVADVTDIHEEAIGFEAHMTAGLARMVYWPDDEGGFFWVVESKTARGWRRFVEHRYRPA